MRTLTPSPGAPRPDLADTQPAQPAGGSSAANHLQNTTTTRDPPLATEAALDA